jgi:hypothetical protein
VAAQEEKLMESIMANMKVIEEYGNLCLKTNL